MMGSGASTAKSPYISGQSAVAPRTVTRQQKSKVKRDGHATILNVSGHTSTKEEEWNWNPFKAKDWKPDVEHGGAREYKERDYI